MDDFKRYTSNTLCGTSNNYMLTENVDRLTCRCYIRPYEHGYFNWRFWFSNAVDSTFGEADVAWANRPGGSWSIVSADISLADSVDGEVYGTTPVFFNGSASYNVNTNERFWSDPVRFGVKNGQYLVWTWTVTGSQIPCTPDSQIPCRWLSDGKWIPYTFGPGNCIPKPNMFAADRGERRRLVFIGDSITQGCGTGMDKYEQWAAQIGNQLDPSVWSVWNIGLGFGRAYDAVTDKAWLWRAKNAGDITAVCFGVNDTIRGRSADDIWRDLCRISRSIRDCGGKVLLLTIPPFDFAGNKESVWREVNRRIREYGTSVADGVFDIATVLGLDAPEDNRAKYGGHPDGIGGAAVAKAFIDSGILDKI